MAMNISVDGYSKILDYQVRENATSLDPGDASAGFGQLTYTVPTEQRLNASTTLTDPEYGSFTGIVSAVSQNDGLYSITADDAFARLNKWLTIPPFTGTLADYLTFLKTRTKMAGTFTTSVTRNVVCPGFRGNVWTEFRKFLAAQGLEAVQNAGNIIVRLPRGSELTTHENITRGTEVNNQTTSQYVTVNYYTMRSSSIASQIAVFPNRRNVEDMEFAPISVNPGETVVQQITLDASLESVNQPTVVDYVSASETGEGTNGMYCVVDQDGKPIPAAGWTKGGGRLVVRLTPDPSIIEVVVTGSSVTEFGTYRIAAGVGSTADSHYNSLRITGRGIRWDQGSVTMHTGAANNADGEDSTTEVDNRFITSVSAAWTAAGRAAAKLSGTVPTASGTFKPRLNPGFGNLVGKRLREENAWFRLTNANFSPHNVQYSLEQDTLVSDFNTHYDTMLVSDFNAIFAGKTVGEFNQKVLS